MTQFLIGLLIPIVLLTILTILNRIYVRSREKMWSKMDPVERKIASWKENHKELVDDPRFKDYVAKVIKEMQEDINRS